MAQFGAKFSSVIPESLAVYSEFYDDFRNISNKETNTCQQKNCVLPAVSTGEVTETRRLKFNV